MKIVFDNNLSSHLAHALRELSRREQDIEEVIHISDRFPRNTPDLQWIGTLTENGPWVILSIDSFAKNNGAEREALKRAGHTVFVLERQWSEQKFWRIAERLVRWWPHILEHARKAEGGYRVPWRHNASGKLQQFRS